MSPIAKAVEPLRSAAQARAMQCALRHLDKELLELEEIGGWDLDKVAPVPHGRLYGEQYRCAAAKRELLMRVTRALKPTHRHGEPNMREISAEAVDRYLQRVREEASEAYDAFIAKLEKKVGECASASLAGDHVWGYSVLSVETPAGCQQWKTQQIVNISSLGKVFNQWPTRKIR